MALIKVKERGRETVNLGRRNLIMNGGMTVAQRGTSASGIGGSNSGTYNAQDRWNFFAYGSPTARWTQSVSTDVPASSTHTTSLKLDCTTASGTVGAGHRQQLMQVIEAQDLQHLRYGSSTAKKVTLSFWVKSSVTGKNYCWIYHNDGTRFTYKSYTVNSANTWERKKITFTGDTASAITNDNGAGLNIIWMLYLGTDYTSATDGVEDTWASWSAGNWDQFNGQVNNASSTSNEWYLTGVQFEVGDTATDYEHRSFEDELHSCKRYYQKSFIYATAPVNAGNTTSNVYDGNIGGYCGSNNSGIYSGGHPFSPEMRANPAMTTYGNSNGHWGQMIPTNTGTVSYSAGAGYIGHIRTNGFSVGQNISGNVLMIGFGQWTADAEL